MIKSALKNWKTTSAGLTLAGGALIHLGYTISAHTCNEAIATATFVAVLGGIGLIAAGDAGQSDAMSDALTRIDALEKQVQTNSSQSQNSQTK